MDVKKITIASVIGGLSHREDPVYLTQPGEFIKLIQKVLKRLESSKKIKGKYQISLSDESDGICSAPSYINLERSVDNNKINIQIKKDCIVFNFGAIHKQSNLFRKALYLDEIVVIVDALHKARNVGKSIECGIMPRIAIPYLEPIAPTVTTDMLSEDIDMLIGAPKKSECTQMKYNRKYDFKDMLIDLDIDTIPDKMASRVFIDMRAKNEKSMRWVFINAKIVFGYICKGIVQSLINHPKTDAEYIESGKKAD